MRVAICGDDNAFRPHFVTWLVHAFRRLGCDVIHCASNYESLGENGFKDSVYIDPHYRFNNNPTPLSEICNKAGHIDLCVMIYQSVSGWSVKNDGACPFAYVWREGNAAEYNMVNENSNGAPCFVCMVGKNAEWPVRSEFMPFAVDRAFIEKPHKTFNEREFGFMYTGRERGGNAWSRLREMLGTKAVSYHFSTYIPNYMTYGDILCLSKMTYAVDSGRYIMSRGLEAMGCGCVVFWDEGKNAFGGNAFDMLGFVKNEDYLPLEVEHYDGDFFPSGNFLNEVHSVCFNEGRFEHMSNKSRERIKKFHTYEHRAQRICDVLNLKMPKHVDEL